MRVLMNTRTATKYIRVHTDIYAFTQIYVCIQTQVYTKIRNQICSYNFLHCIILLFVSIFQSLASIHVWGNPLIYCQSIRTTSRSFIHSFCQTARLNRTGIKIGLLQTSIRKRMFLDIYRQASIQNLIMLLCTRRWCLFYTCEEFSIFFSNEVPCSKH